MDKRTKDVIVVSLALGAAVAEQLGHARAEARVDRVTLDVEESADAAHRSLLLVRPRRARAGA